VHVDADDLLVALLHGDLVDEGRLGDLGHEPAVLDAAQDAEVIEPSVPISLTLAKIASASASIWSVSCSTYQEPPSGSATFMTPVSSAMTCWVRSAICAAFSLGSASTSSRALVCRLLVPPRTAASASTAVRTTLLSGCCAVSETPAVWVWKRSHCALSVFAP
jgi:hypothetical protein